MNKILIALILTSSISIAQKPYKISSTSKYVLMDSVNMPRKVLIQFQDSDRSQYGIIYKDTLYTVRYGTLHLIKKQVKNYAYLPR